MIFYLSMSRLARSWRTLIPSHVSHEVPHMLIMDRGSRTLSRARILSVDSEGRRETWPYRACAGSAVMGDGQ